MLKACLKHDFIALKRPIGLSYLLILVCGLTLGICVRGIESSLIENNTLLVAVCAFFVSLSCFGVMGGNIAGKNAADYEQKFDFF